MTRQSHNTEFKDAEPYDDIRVFLGEIPAEEFEQRCRIRSARNCASFKASQTESSNARTLCWMATECATAFIYSTAPLDELTEVATFLRRLLILANQAESLECGA